MRFTCPRETFLQGLQIVQRAVPSKTTLPILTGILLETANDRLRLVATDLELGVECYVPVETKEEGSTVLDARFLTDIVRKLPDLAIDFRVDAQKSQAEINSGTAKYQLHTMSPADYPTLPETDGEKTWELAQATLKRAFRETAFAVALDETRPFLTGVYLEINGEQVRFVATDTSRLALCQTSSPNKIQQATMIIPLKCIQELSRVLATDAESTVSVTLSGNHIVFELPAVRFISRLIEGQFPSYQQVIPKSYKTRVEVARETFLAAAERASLLAREGPSIVKISTSETMLGLSAFVPEVGFSEEQVAATREGDDTEIAFNTRFIIEVLRTLDTASVALELTGRHSPGTIKPVGVDGEEYTYVVMPVMLR